MRTARMILGLGATLFGALPCFAGANLPTVDSGSLPAEYSNLSDFSSSAPDNDLWWKGFNDPVLDSLISVGVQNNYNVAIAANRIEIARQSIVAARSGYYPTVGLSAGWNRERISGATSVSDGKASNASYFDLGLNVSWEVDVFGRVRQGVKEKQAEYSVERADYDAVMISLAAQIASTYTELRMYQTQLAIARAQDSEQQRVVDITRDRMDAGLGNALEVSQANIVLSSTRASVPPLEAKVATTVNTLATLLGVYPDEIRSMLQVPETTLTAVGIGTSSILPDYRRLVAVGVPMDLLRRRPDIAEAEAQLAAYAAQLGVAKKDFLPTLSINGSLGTEAHRFDDLFANNSLTYSIAPTLSWTIFDGFSRRAANATARQNIEIGIENYNQTLLNAVTEVDNAMIEYRSALQQIDYLQNTVDDCRRALTLSVDLYKQGLAAFTNVVDAQENLLQYQNSLASARAGALEYLINLYKALGGGF